MLQAGTITMPEQITNVSWMIITEWLGERFMLCESWDLFIGLKMV
jgi:hypothetical protein